MRFALSRTLVVAALAASTASVAYADVKTQERTQVKFEGMLGRMMGMFGGKAMKDGLVSSIAIKGDRELSVTEDTGEIVDLREEKVYHLDLKKKTYTVVTFEEMRRQLREAQEKARQQAKEAKPEAEQKKADEPQMEVEFDLKETGQKKSILGYDCREVVMTVTTHEKGKKLEESGGLVMATHLWLAPEIPALKERMEFNRRYAQKVYGELISPETMQQMAAAMAMYPGMKDAITRMNKESVNMSGTPLLTTMAFQTVVSEQQAAEQRKQQESESSPSSTGGLSGMLARKMMKKKPEPAEGAQAGNQSPNRATIFTSTNEVLKIATDVAPADVALPAGFTEKR